MLLSLAHELFPLHCVAKNEKVGATVKNPIYFKIYSFMEIIRIRTEKRFMLIDQVGVKSIG